MDRWMNGWTDGWADGWLYVPDRLVGGQLDSQIDNLVLFKWYGTEKGICVSSLSYKPAEKILQYVIYYVGGVAFVF